MLSLPGTALLENARMTHVLAVLRRRLSLTVLGAMAVVSLGVAAFAFWAIAGAGSASAGTGTLGAATNVTAVAPLNSSTVAVNWTGGSLGTGQPAQGYY